MGEVCGAKLTDTESVVKVAEVCRFCQELDVKRRRRQREVDNIVRWNTEGDRFRASIERATREVQVLDTAIDELDNRRSSVMTARRASADGTFLVRGNDSAFKQRAPFGG